MLGRSMGSDVKPRPTENYNVPSSSWVTCSGLHSPTSCASLPMATEDLPHRGHNEAHCTWLLGALFEVMTTETMEQLWKPKFKIDFSLPLISFWITAKRKRKEKTILRHNTQLPLQIKHNKLNIDLTTITISVCPIYLSIYYLSISP